MKLVVIDPRRTATCELADLHLPVKAGTDVWLFNGLLSYLQRIGAVDPAFIRNSTNGFEAALETANVDCSDPAAVAKICRIELPVLMEFYESFAATRKTITAFSMGVNQSSAGTDKVNAIINCHLIGGRIGKPGMGPFSITGQPNAMGGREVGGLANMQAAHMDLDRADHRDVVQTFWESPAMADKPGLKAVDLFQAIEAGKVKAVWVIATNLSSACRTPTRCAAHWKNANWWSPPTSSRTPTPTPTPTCCCRRWAGARRMAPSPIPSAASRASAPSCRRRARRCRTGRSCRCSRSAWVLKASISAAPMACSTSMRVLAASATPIGDVPRAFDMSGLGGLGQREYDDLEPTQWPVRRAASGELQVEARLFKDNVYAHADGKARFIATATRSPVNAVSEDFPLALNTGRVRDQWHTMTRTGKSATLADHIAESFVDIHPQDALLHGVREGELARVTSQWGAMVARVQHGGGIARGSVFIPIHWSGQTSSDARVGALVIPWSIRCPASRSSSTRRCVSSSSA